MTTGFGHGLRWISFLLYLLPLAGYGEPVQLRLAIDLRDGSRVMGTPAFTNIVVKSELGRLELSLTNVVTVAVGEPARAALVHLRSGDRLKGKLEKGNFEVHALPGRLSVSVKTVRRVYVLRPGDHPPLVPAGLRDAVVLALTFEDDYCCDWSGNARGVRMLRREFDPGGPAGRGLRFTGKKSRVVIPGGKDGQIELSGERSASFWWKADAKASGYMPTYVEPRRISGDAGVRMEVQMHRVQGQKAPSLTYALGRGRGFTSYSQAIRAGEWYHLVLVRLEGKWRLYHDGWPGHASTFGATHRRPDELPTGTGAILGAAHLYDWHFKGSMDEVLLFNRALTEDEVKALYKLQAPVVLE